MLGIAGDVINNEDDYSLCVLLSTPCHALGYEFVGEPSEGAAVARRLWNTALNLGGSVRPQPRRALRLQKSYYQGGRIHTGEPLSVVKGLVWMRMPDEDAMNELWCREHVMPSARLLALMRKLRAAASVAGKLVVLYKAVLEKSYAPSGAGYKRAREDFEARLPA